MVTEDHATLSLVAIVRPMNPSVSSFLRTSCNDKRRIGKLHGFVKKVR